MQGLFGSLVHPPSLRPALPMLRRHNKDFHFSTRIERKNMQSLGILAAFSASGETLVIQDLSSEPQRMYWAQTFSWCQSMTIPVKPMPKPLKTLQGTSMTKTSKPVGATNYQSIKQIREHIFIIFLNQFSFLPDR